jgi:hypothetical protein
MRTLLLALLFPALAHAQTFGVELHGKSWHGDLGPFNERNPGVGGFIRHGNLYGHVGAYKNSYSNQSFYLAAEWLPIQSRWIDAGIGGGTATGYATGGLAGYLKAHVKLAPQFYLALRYIPPIKEDGVSITRGLRAASIGWEW